MTDESHAKKVTVHLPDKSSLKLTGSTSEKTLSKIKSFATPLTRVHFRFKLKIYKNVLLVRYLTLYIGS